MYKTVKTFLQQLKVFKKDHVLQDYEIIIFTQPRRCINLTPCIVSA